MNRLAVGYDRWSLQIVSLETTLNERIGVLLWHNFKVFVFLRIPKGGMGGGCFSPPSTPPKSATGDTHIMYGFTSYKMWNHCGW